MLVNQRRITFYCDRNVREAFSETMKCCEATPTPTARRFIIRKCSSVASVKMQSDEAFAAFLEGIIQLYMACR